MSERIKKEIKKGLGGGKYKYGMREPSKNPVYFTTKKERDKAVKKTKKGAWIINLKT